MDHLPPVTPQEGDIWCCIHPACVTTRGCETFFLIKLTFNERISHGWKCYVTSSHHPPRLEVIDVRAVQSWYNSTNYIKVHEALG